MGICCQRSWFRKYNLSLGGPYLTDDRGCYLQTLNRKGNYIEDEKKEHILYRSCKNSIEMVLGFMIWQEMLQNGQNLLTVIQPINFRLSNPYLSNQAYREVKKNL